MYTHMCVYIYIYVHQISESRKTRRRANVGTVPPATAKLEYVGKFPSKGDKDCAGYEEGLESHRRI